jgi:glutathione S-transferase
MERVRFVEKLAWMNNTVHPTFTHIFMPHKYTDDAAAQQALKSFNTGVYRQLLAEMEDMLRKERAAGHEWLGAGPHSGPLDFYALTLLRWGTIAGIDPQDTPDLWAHVQRTAQMPAVMRVMERERLQLNLFKPAPETAA